MTHGAHTLSSAPSRRFSGWIAFGCVLAAVGVLATTGLSWVTSSYWQSPKLTVAAARNVGVIPTAGPKATTATAANVSPDRIVIPKLKSQAPVIKVSTLATGALDVPLNPRTVGWWSGGARPGAKTGTAVLAGHINYSGVEGALAKINTLSPNDTVYVYGVRGGKSTRLTFRITGVRTYSKKALPYKEIFDQSVAGRLAIVTCGGPFDASTGNYLDNIVAFAVPA